MLAFRRHTPQRKSPVPVPKTQLAFHRRERWNIFRSHARPQSRLFAHQAEEFVERFHLRVMFLFARLAVGSSAAFLLELFDRGLNLRVLLLNQDAERKRGHVTDPAQQRRSHDHHRRFRL